jgi:hypothetical protein
MLRGDRSPADDSLDLGLPICYLHRTSLFPEDDKLMRSLQILQLRAKKGSEITAEEMRVAQQCFQTNRHTFGFFKYIHTHTALMQLAVNDSRMQSRSADEIMIIICICSGESH